METRNRLELASSPEADAMGQLLRRHGILPTHQRMLIARLILTGPCHLCAEQVMEALAEVGEHVSKATVYNTLGLFARCGLLREVVVERSMVFYDSNVVAHHHFYDTTTGALTDIPETSLAIHRLPTPPSGMEVDGIDIIVRLRPCKRTPVP